jgi:DNA topoisomerase-1
LVDRRHAGDAARGNVQARLVGADGKKISASTSARARRRRRFKRRSKPPPSPSPSVEAKPVKRHPHPPFTTSTLQQEASRKLGLAPARTMQVAQRLYEGVDIGGGAVGLITYMRTDGVDLAPEAVSAARA